MTPEVNSAIRTVLAAVLAFAAGKGWIGQDTDFATLSNALAVVGVAAVTAWGVWAKRPKSSEAQQVAQNVQATQTDANVPPSDISR